MPKFLRTLWNCFCHCNLVFHNQLVHYNRVLIKWNHPSFHIVRKCGSRLAITPVSEGIRQVKRPIRLLVWNLISLSGRCQDWTGGFHDVKTLIITFDIINYGAIPAVLCLNLTPLNTLCKSYVCMPWYTLSPVSRHYGTTSWYMTCYK